MSKPSKGFKYLSFSFLLSSLFFWSFNVLQINLEDFLTWQASLNMSLKSQISAEENENAAIAEQFRPLRNWNVEYPQIQAKAAVSILFSSNNEQKILFDKNSELKLPIASLTKLMTALVVTERYDLSQIIQIAGEKPEDNTQLKNGEKFEVEDLLYFLLIASDNGAGDNLARLLGKESFVSLMNQKAEELGLSDTVFYSPSGLDPKNPLEKEKINTSTARDVATFTEAACENELICKILATREIEIFSRENLNVYLLVNTNELLGKMPEIIAGKTGSTPMAKDCLAVITNAPRNNGKIVSVILGSDNRFDEMTKIINWLNEGFQW